jgi:diacylglycerol kinase family enzyme
MLPTHTQIELETEQPARLMVDGDLIGFTPLKVIVRPGAFALFTTADPAGS